MNKSYTEGSVFSIPLDDDSMARGIVARCAPSKRILFGYFFGPRIQLEAEIEWSELTAQSAIFCLRFGDLALHKGLWPVVGRIADWNAADWPMCNFIRRDPLGNVATILVRYDDRDPSKVVNEQPSKADGTLPSDGLAGYKFVEAKLNKLLA